MRALTITIDPEQGSGNAPYLKVATVDLPDGHGRLAAMQAAVGGYVEPVDVLGIDGLIDGTVTQWHHDEGKLIGAPYNHVASRLVRHSGLAPGDHIVGNTVVTGFDPETGETVGLTDAQHVVLLVELADLTADAVSRHQVVLEPAVAQPVVTALDEARVDKRLKSRSVEFSWTVGDAAPGVGDTDPTGDGPGKVTAVLSVHHYRKAYTARLSQETWTDTPYGQSRSFWMGAGPSAVLVAQEATARYSAKRLEAFADEALATLRTIVKAGDLLPEAQELVGAIFAAPKLAAPVPV